MATTAESKAKMQYVSPDLLDFDVQNPRFAGQLTGMTQASIQKHIFGEPH
jgi:hypothetical protein